ncbi:hypothetical protein CI238_11172, partial [Colletotrichum incanum]
LYRKIKIKGEILEDRDKKSSKIRKRRRQLLRLAACLGFRKLRSLFVIVKLKPFVVVYKKSISLMP